MITADEYDLQELQAYSDEELDQLERQELQTLKEALAQSPVFSAWIRARGLRVYRQRSAMRMQQLAQSLEPDSRYPRPLNPPGPGSEKLEGVLNELLSSLIYAEADRLETERAQARRQAIEGEK